MSFREVRGELGRRLTEDMASGMSCQTWSLSTSTTGAVSSGSRSILRKLKMDRSVLRLGNNFCWRRALHVYFLDHSLGQEAQQRRHRLPMQVINTIRIGSVITNTGSEMIRVFCYESVVLKYRISCGLSMLQFRVHLLKPRVYAVNIEIFGSKSSCIFSFLKLGK